MHLYLPAQLQVWAGEFPLLVIGKIAKATRGAQLISQVKDQLFSTTVNKPLLDFLPFKVIFHCYSAIITLIQEFTFSLPAGLN